VNGIWRYRIKTQQNLITSYKSRLCADGRWIQALAEEVFAGTPVGDTVFLLFALAAFYEVEVISGDVPAAYVQAPMPDKGTKFYINQPQGYVDKDNPTHVLLLLKCLYGLPHSGHQWNEEIAMFLEECGMVRSKTDPSSFFMQDQTGILIMVITVDDTIDMSTSKTLRSYIHGKLTERFRWKNLGKCDWHLGMRIIQNSDRITIDQTAYLATILEQFNNQSLYNTNSPMSKILQPPLEGEPTTDFPYQSLMGCLIWMAKTRFDIAYAVSQCARFMSNHQQHHDKAVLKILGYLRKHSNWGVGFLVNHGDKTAINIQLASDSSHADVIPERTSSFCYMSFIQNCCFQTRSRITPRVCHNSHEAEYHALYEACKQARFLLQMLTEWNVPIVTPFPNDIDNQAAMRTAQSYMITQRSKHIDIRCHSIRESIAKGEVSLHKVPDPENRADVGTKPYGGVKMSVMRPKIMMEVKVE
jgi:hypothetical protein